MRRFVLAFTNNKTKKTQAPKKVQTKKTNSYQVFSKPKEAVASVMKDILHAKKSVKIETYHLKYDKVGGNLLKLLIKKSKKISVQVIVDNWGTKKLPKNLRKEIQNSKNMNFSFFHSSARRNILSRIVSYIQNKYVGNHRKLTIIDDTIAYVGGMNYHKKELLWRDIFVRIQGPIVSELIRAYKESEGMIGTTIFSSRKIDKSLTKQFTEKDIIIRQIPYSRESRLLPETKKIIKNAKKEICITTPYFIPEPSFFWQVIQAAKRGVQIKIVIPKKSDIPPWDILSQWFSAKLAEQIGIQIHLAPKMTHAKYLIVDNKICTFGSGNFDYRSFLYNYELNIMTKNKQVVTTLRKIFLEDFKKAKPFPLGIWKKRSWKRKLYEKFLLHYKENF